MAEVSTSDDLNWTKSDSCVSKGRDDEALRDVSLTTTEVPDWDSYDTVFIGYPKNVRQAQQVVAENKESGNPVKYLIKMLLKQCPKRNIIGIFIQRR